MPELRFNRAEIVLGDKWRSPGAGIIESVEPDYEMCIRDRCNSASAIATTDNDTDKYSKECGICGRNQGLSLIHI